MKITNITKVLKCACGSTTVYVVAWPGWVDGEFIAGTVCELSEDKHRQHQERDKPMHFGIESCWDSNVSRFNEFGFQDLARLDYPGVSLVKLPEVTVGLSILRTPAYT